MNSRLLSGQAAMPLIRGIYYLLSAERARELTCLLAKGACHEEGETSPLAVVTALAIHVEQHRMDRTSRPIYLGREQLMTGAADLLGEAARFEDQDVFRLLALLLDKLLRGEGAVVSQAGWTHGKRDGIAGAGGASHAISWAMPAGWM
ncbi:hypothetical protein OR606_06750 [Aeromonas hydrophila]|uniref:hypothetical protein n=1 Tax=Aeromonas hydrophila TaxID=644 RepID=UPI0022584789|nr:hypothetical protein [Aeromonas hydrophila]MCX4039899.1 hypothetical protein [Aeromonas hydrophila]